MNLDELLKEAITKPEKRPLFLQRLIKSDVYVICKNPVRQDEVSGGVSMELVTTQNPEGEVFIPFFSSYRALQQFAKRYVNSYRINCLRLFDLIQTANAVLNPNSFGKEFSSREIRSILMVARNLNIPAISMKEEENIEYRPAKRNVDHLLRPMTRYLARQDNVEKCYLLEMVRGCERPQTLFVFDMSGNTRKLFYPLSKYMQNYTKSGDSLVFVTLEEPSAKKAVEHMQPFYTRKKRLFER